MRKRTTLILVGCAIFALGGVLAALRSADLSQYVRIVVATDDTGPSYQINGRLVKIDAMLRLLGKLGTAYTGPIEVHVDDRTSFVTVARLITDLKTACPKNRWVVSYHEGTKKVCVLRDATVDDAAAVEYMLVHEVIEETTNTHNTAAHGTGSARP